jgi:Zn-finger nucleic acid-binding protein
MVGALTGLRCAWRFGALRRRLGEALTLEGDDDPTRARVIVRSGSEVFRGIVDLAGNHRRVVFDIPVGPLPAVSAPDVSLALFDGLRARVQQRADDVDCTVERLRVVGWLEASAVLDTMAMVDLLRLMQRLDEVTLARFTRRTAVLEGSGFCPSCQEPLHRRQGRHREDVCPGCGGSFFSGVLAGPLLLERFDVTPGTVADARGSAGRAGPCPGCAQAMRPVLINDVIADVCGGCGGVWLDSDEREALLP